MYVYRVEDANKEGPYTYSDRKGTREMTEAHGSSTNARPTPYNDGLRGVYMHHISTPNRVCGFLSLKQLLWWFQGYERYLEERGFFITVYREKTVYKGRTQCVFDRTSEPTSTYKFSEVMS